MHYVGYHAIRRCFACIMHHTLSQMTDAGVESDNRDVIRSEVERNKPETMWLIAIFHALQRSLVVESIKMHVQRCMDPLRRM